MTTKTASSLWLTLICLSLGVASTAYTEVAPPTLDKVAVHGEVSCDAACAEYSYTFTVANLASNGVSFWLAELNTSATQGLVPAAGFAPPGWGALLSEHEHAMSWGCRDSPGPLKPGETLVGIGLRSRALPALREMKLLPELAGYIDEVAADWAQQGKYFDSEDEIALKEKMVFRTKTLGPLGETPGSFAHWDTWQADIAQARQLGWISDTTLATTIETNVGAARQAILAGDSATARTKLQAVIDAIQASQTSQRTSEGHALVFFNAQYLRDHLPRPCEPKLRLAPESATQPIGTSYTATATLINAADGKPFPGFYVIVSVISGPHVGVKTYHGVDENGNITLTYTGTKLGEDQILAWTLTGPSAFLFDFASSAVATCIPFGAASQYVKVKWEGGPDLAVTSFFPPVIRKTGGQKVLVTEKTENLGNTAAPPSVTRYYLSATESINPATASVLGERSVPELAAGASSSVDEYAFTVPSDLPEGLYYLGACADADGTVIETNEVNNCSFSEMSVIRQTFVAIERTNQPPDCSQVHADPSVLWPPNHKLVPIQILGVTDPEGDPISITVTGITQDEPTNGLGDGDSGPDGFGVGTGQPQVRAERAGTGNGRVYVISFRAEDGQGGSCTGLVKVSVPHDKGKGEAVDDGQSYDSTK